MNAKSLKCCVVFLATLGSSDLDPLLIVEGVNEPVLRRGHILFVANVADDMQLQARQHILYTPVIHTKTGWTATTHINTAALVGLGMSMAKPLRPIKPIFCHISRGSNRYPFFSEENCV